MPKKKEPELTPAEQFKRFREAAKKAGVTQDEKEFEGVFRKVAPESSKNKK
jgi:hypothetical protein